MCKKMKQSLFACVLLGLIASMCGPAQANWLETFGGNAFDVPTWKFLCVPDMAKTYKGIIKDGPNDNDYLALVETTSIGVMPPGSLFGGAFASDEKFADVRVGAVVNVVGDASRNNYVLVGRGAYTIEGPPTKPYPGLWTNCYVLIMYWDEGPANLFFAVQKVIDNDASDVMVHYKEDFAAVMPGLNHTRSYYAELDIVGSDPVYVTGSVYEFKGGPLVARAPTLIDTNVKDPWEEERAINYPVFGSGVSGICAYNGDPEPPGYYCTFDDVFSVSDGPATVNPSPADGATGVSMEADLSWVEAAFATSRELWFGKQGAMQKITPPGKTYDPGTLEFGQTYEWRVDEIGPSGTVTGHTWTFTVRSWLSVDDFESYGNAETPGPPPPAGSRVWYTWKDGEGWTVPSVTPGNGTGSVTGLSGDIVHGGKQSLTYSYDNDGTNALGTSGKKYYSEIGADTANLAVGSDWTKQGVKALTLWFYGDPGNDAGEQMYVKLDGVKVVYDGDMDDVKDPSWHEWNIDLAEFGINLQNVTQICIGFGDENNTTPAGSGTVYFDDIRLYPPRCISPGTYPGDINGDCFVNSQDLDLMTADWLKCDYTVLPQAPTVGPAGWWKFDETSGLYAYDSSANDLKGLLFNGPVWVAGYIGGAVKFDGIDDYVDVLDDPNLNPSSAITAAAWINPSAWTGNDRVLQKGNSDNQYRLLREDNVFKWHLASVVGGLATVDTVPAVGEWHHVAGTYDGSKMRIYYDGSIVAENPASGQILATADRLYIGTKNDTAPSGDHFEGLIDDVRIYGYGLSQAEILSVWFVRGLRAADGARQFNRSGAGKPEVCELRGLRYFGRRLA